MTHTTTFRQKDNSRQTIVSQKKKSGKQKQKSKQGFPTKQETKEYEATIVRAKKQPRPVDKDMAEITLKDFCEDYQKIILTPNLCYNTVQDTFIMYQEIDC